MTGGASGIGAATVAELRSRGAQVVVLDRSAPPGDHSALTAGSPAANAPTADAIVVDVTNRAGVDAAVTEVVRRHGGLDILVNCAGIECRGPLTEVDDDEALRVLDVNILGMMRTMRATTPHLMRSRVGAIVNVGSVAASTGMAGLSVYSATKGAVAAMTRSVAAELLPHGVRANCVTPATVDTPWVQRTLSSSSDPGSAADALKARQPMGRLVTAGEVAAAIVYLAGPAARSITGISLDVDGGMISLSPAQDVSTVSRG